MSIHVLPAELQLKVASYLQLRELILLRNASKHWQSLINNHLTSIRPARRKLLRLWDDTIRSPYFLPSRTYVLPALKPFDRAEYLDSLSCGLDLPGEFELWVLEWPAKAVIGWTWPGLDLGRYTHWNEIPPTEATWQLHGTNPLRASWSNRAASVFTLSEATECAGYEGYWVERGTRDARRNIIIDDDDDEEEEQHAAATTTTTTTTGLAIPVWMLQPRSGQDANSPAILSVAHMLVVRGPEGATSGGDDGGMVLPFNVRVHLDSGRGRYYRFATLPCNGECHCGRCPRYDCMWSKADMDQSVRAASWIEWLRRCLGALEENYVVHCAASEDEGYWTMVRGWEGFVFRAVDLEHLPKSCEIDGVAYRLGGLGGGSGRFHELFEPELRAA